MSLEKVVCLIVATIIGVTLILGVYWLIWQGYMYLIAYWCSTCSPTVLTPPYWIFALTLFALTWLGNLLRGSK